MSTFTNDPAAALQVAHQTVAERIAEAQPRARARALRAQQRASRRADHASPLRHKRPPRAFTWVVRLAR
jgi:hypothetical protein